MIRPALALTLCSLVTASLSAPAQHAAAHAAGDAAAGEVTFQHNCLMCHSVDQDVKIVGPSLYSVMRGPHALTATTVRGIIVKGKGQMPPLGDKLAEQDLANLLAYLKKL